MTEGITRVQEKKTGKLGAWKDIYTNASNGESMVCVQFDGETSTRDVPWNTLTFVEGGEKE